MESYITIKNENIANYVMFILDKLDNKFTEEELNTITEITIDYEDILENNSILKELLLFRNLNTLNLRNAFIYNDDYNYLLNLEKLNNLYLDRCKFENADLIASLKLKSLSLINCEINNYLFVNLLTELEELTIINGEVDIDNINKLTKLNYLQLSYSNILGNELVIKLDNLKELYVDNTNIRNLTFTNNLLNLNRLSIDEFQYKYNNEFIKQLRNRNISIYNENMVEFLGDDYEA